MNCLQRSVTMSTKELCVALCLLAGYITNSRGLHVSMNRTVDGLYCGQLRCLSDITTTDTNVLSIVSLTIYDITKASDHIRLASATIFAPDLQVEPTKEHIVNVTGRVSTNHAELTVRFRSPADCLNASFLCELDFVNVSGKPEVKTEMVSPQEGDDCGIYPAMLSKQLALMAAQIKSNSDDRDEQYKEYKQESDQRFNALVGQLSSIQSNLSSSREQQQTKCPKGVTDVNPRRRFLLWGNVDALCDTVTDAGGWIIMQRRTKGDVDFNRPWADYKNGFGTPDTDFWLGLDVIHNITWQSSCEVRIDMIYDEVRYYAHYSNFYVANETMKYKLSVSGHTGTAGDSMTPHNSMYFSTFDSDNDSDGRNCANLQFGGWWYGTCYYYSNLNGLWGAHNYSGVVWYHIAAANSVSFTEIKIRYT